MNGPNLPANIPVALKMLFFFAFGRSFFMWLSSDNKRVISKGKSFILGCAMLVLTVFVACNSPKVDYAGDDFPNILSFLITAFTGVLGICFFSMGIAKSNFMEHIGRATLPILVMHKFSILLFQTVGPFKVYLMQYDSFIGVMVAVFVSVISILLCLLADWIICRYLPFVYGDFSSVSCHIRKSFKKYFQSHKKG